MIYWILAAVLAVGGLALVSRAFRRTENFVLALAAILMLAPIGALLMAMPAHQDLWSMLLWLVVLSVGEVLLLLAGAALAGSFGWLLRKANLWRE